MTPQTGPDKQHKPFVPENVEMTEFTLRAVLIGLAMTVILGAANAYLGLRAGQTIAATYPAAVIGMAGVGALPRTRLRWRTSLTAQDRHAYRVRRAIRALRAPLLASPR